jgi:hypothetical protein
MTNTSSGAVGAADPSSRDSSSAVDTAKIAGRRTLRFASLEDAVRDAEQLAELERRGRLQRLGNWTLGQALGHLAAWNNYPFDGYPVPTPPWFIKLILRLVLKRKYLRDGFPAGVRIPGVDGGTAATGPLTTDDGLHAFRRSVERLRSTQPPLPSPAFGHLSHEEAKALAMRHAELHLSFFKPA